jgi:hypothetical protein
MSQSKAVIDVEERLRRCGSPQAIANVWSDWRNAHPQPPDLSGIRFEELHFPPGIDFSQLRLVNATFEKCELETGNFHKSDLTGVLFKRCTLTAMKFDNATVSGGRFEDCNISHGELRRSKLIGANFTRCNLRSAAFTESDLTGASFSAVDVNRSTTFQNLNGCNGCRIDRFVLACLGESNGSLTDGNLMEMTVVDDVAQLRQQFGGIWGQLQALSLIVFVFPYFWFLIRQWSVAKFVTPHLKGETMALWEAMARFIVRGGVDWRSSWAINWLPFLTFLLILAYNVVRGVLLWKTKKLETEQQVKGLPALFSMEQPIAIPGGKSLRVWHWLYQANRYGFWLSFILIMLNAWHFLTMRIPV